LSAPALKKHVYRLIADYFDEKLKPSADAQAAAADKPAAAERRKPHHPAAK
jgi:hypothetical protein